MSVPVFHQYNMAEQPYGVPQNAPVLSYAYPQLPEALWRRGWSVWSCQRRRARMAQFIVDHLHKNVNGRWIDISRGKFQLNSWPEIAKEWYKVKERDSDPSDATSMLRKGLPRAFPNLVEVKDEAEKDGTQYVKRVFQAPPSLMTEVFRCALHPTTHEDMFFAPNDHMSQFHATQPAMPMMKSNDMTHATMMAAQQQVVPKLQAPSMHSNVSPHYGSDAILPAPSPSDSDYYSERLDSISSSSSPSSSLRHEQLGLHTKQFNLFERQETIMQLQQQLQEQQLQHDEMMASMPGFPDGNVLDSPLGLADDALLDSRYEEFLGWNYNVGSDAMQVVSQPQFEPKVGTNAEMSWTSGQHPQTNLSISSQPAVTPQSPPSLVPGSNLQGQITPTNPASQIAISPLLAPQATSPQREPGMLNIQLSPSRSPLRGGGQLFVFHVDPEPLPDGQLTLVFYSPSLRNGNAVTAMRANLFILIATVPPHCVAEEVTVHLVVDGVPRGHQPFEYFDAEAGPGRGETLGNSLSDQLCHMQGMIGSMLNHSQGSQGGYPGGQQMQQGSSYQEYSHLMHMAVETNNQALLRMLLRAPLAANVLSRPLPNGKLPEKFARDCGRTQMAECMKSLRLRHACVKAGQEPCQSLPHPLLLLDSTYTPATHSVASLCHALTQLSVAKSKEEKKSSSPVKRAPVKVIEKIQEIGEASKKVEISSATSDLSKQAASSEMSSEQRAHYIQTISRFNVLQKELKDVQKACRKMALTQSSLQQTVSLLQEHCIHASEQRNIAVSRMMSAVAEIEDMKERELELETDRNEALKERDQAREDLEVAASQERLVEEYRTLKEQLSTVQEEKEELVRKEVSGTTSRRGRGTVRTKRRYFREVKFSKGVESGYISTSVSDDSQPHQGERRLVTKKEDSAYSSGETASSELMSQESVEAYSPEELQVFQLPAGAKEYGLKLESVVYVREVEPGSVAERKLKGKVQAGDQIVAVNDCELLRVLNADEAGELLKLGTQRSGGPLLTIYSPPGEPLTDPDPVATLRPSSAKLSLGRYQPRRLSPIPTATPAATPSSPVPSTVLPFFSEKQTEKSAPDVS